MLKHGERLQELAKEKGLTYSALGELLGKTRQSVGYDMRQDFLKMPMLREYCRVIGIDIEEFYFRNESKKQDNFTDSELKEKEYLHLQNESLKRENSALREAVEALKMSVKALARGGGGGGFS